MSSEPVSGAHDPRGQRAGFVGALLVSACVILYSVAKWVYPAVGAQADFSLQCNYAYVLAGEWWRIFTYWLPHLDSTHLIWDIAYLIVVGIVCERSVGHARFVLMFFAFSATGGITAALCDGHHTALVGSSVGTHGLAAYWATRQFLAPGEHLAMRLSWLAVLAYLGYLTWHGLAHGVMGWPFGFFPNGGFDHLGGIGAGAGIAAFERLFRALASRRRAGLRSA